MHGQHRDTRVDHVHAVLGAHVGDGAAAAHVHLAQLRGLEVHARAVHDAADLGHVLGVGIVAAALAAPAGELVEADAVAEQRRVLLLKHAREVGVEARAHVGGEHAAVAQRPAQRQGALLARRRHQLRDGILEIVGRHAGRAHAADLLLVGEDGAQGVLRHALVVRQRAQGGIGADPVVVAVAQDHAPVEAQIPRLSGGDDLQFGGEQILLLQVVLILEELQHSLLHRLLLLARQRFGADDQVQGLALDHLGGGLLHLILGQVDQQVGEAEHRVVLALAQGDGHLAPVAADDHAVEGQRLRDPLVLLDPAVIVGVEVGDVPVLIEGVLLHVYPGRVDVGAHNVHALGEGLAAEDEGHEALPHPGRVDPVAGLEGAALLHDVLQVGKAGLLRLGHRLGDALPLGLACVQETPVVPRKGLQLRLLRRLILFPRVFAVHRTLLLSARRHACRALFFFFARRYYNRKQKPAQGLMGGIFAPLPAAAASD